MPDQHRSSLYKEQKARQFFTLGVFFWLRINKMCRRRKGENRYPICPGKNLLCRGQVGPTGPFAWFELRRSSISQRGPRGPMGDPGVTWRSHPRLILNHCRGTAVEDRSPVPVFAPGQLDIEFCLSVNDTAKQRIHVGATQLFSFSKTELVR